MIAFTLKGQMPSGKNQQQLLFRGGRVIKYPNKRFKTWRDEAGYQLIQQGVKPAKPIDKPVALYCTYCPQDRRVRDVSGMVDALFHLLVWGQIMKDDGLVYDCLWRRMAIGKPALYVEIHDWKEPV